MRLDGLARLKLIGALARARLAGIGTNAQLTPGRLVVDQSRFFSDQFHLLKLQREHGDIFKVWASGKLTTCIVGHAKGLRLLNENRAKLRAASTDVTPLFPAGFLRMMEGELHSRYRRIFLSAFKAVSIEAQEAAISAVISSCLPPLALGKGPLTGDAVAEVAKRATTAIMLQLILGAEHRSQIGERLARAYDDYSPHGMPIVVGERQHAGFEELRKIVGDHADRLMRMEGAPRSLLEYIVKYESVDETIIGNLIHMAELARFDLHGLWRWLLFEMATEGMYLERIAAEPNAETRRRMALSVASETLRMHQSEFIQRTAIETFTFDGFLIPRRSRIKICIFEGHRDPRNFECPHVFKSDRFLRATIGNDIFAPLGLDHHRCLGAGWVMRLSSLLVEEIARNFSISLVNPGIPRRHGHFHFEPGQDFSVLLSRKT